MCANTHIALLTGGFALAGVALSQIFSVIHSRYTQKHQKAILLRTKYEEMTMLFVDSMNWSANLLDATSPKDILGFAQSTLANQVHMLCTIYFRRLLEASGQYLEACSVLYHVSVRSYNSLDKRPLGQQVSNNQDYKDASGALVKAIAEFHKQVAIHSKTYTRA